MNPLPIPTADIPHLLIIGSRGNGKSTTLRSWAVLAPDVENYVYTDAVETTEYVEKHTLIWPATGEQVTLLDTPGELIHASKRAPEWMKAFRGIRISAVVVVAAPPISKIPVAGSALESAVLENNTRPDMEWPTHPLEATRRVHVSLEAASQIIQRLGGQRVASVVVHAAYADLVDLRAERHILREQYKQLWQQSIVDVEAIAKADRMKLYDALSSATKRALPWLQEVEAPGWADNLHTFVSCNLGVNPFHVSAPATSLRCALDLIGDERARRQQEELQQDAKRQSLRERSRRGRDALRFVGRLLQVALAVLLVAAVAFGVLKALSFFHRRDEVACATLVGGDARCACARVLADERGGPATDLGARVALLDRHLQACGAEPPPELRALRLHVDLARGLVEPSRLEEDEYVKALEAMEKASASGAGSGDLYPAMSDGELRFARWLSESVRGHMERAGEVITSFTDDERRRYTGAVALLRRLDPAVACQHDWQVARQHPPPTALQRAPAPGTNPVDPWWLADKSCGAADVPRGVDTCFLADLPSSIVPGRLASVAVLPDAAKLCRASLACAVDAHGLWTIASQRPASGRSDAAYAFLATRTSSVEDVDACLQRATGLPDSQRRWIRLLGPMTPEARLHALKDADFDALAEFWSSCWVYERHTSAGCGRKATFDENTPQLVLGSGDDARIVSTLCAVAGVTDPEAAATAGFTGSGLTPPRAALGRKILSAYEGTPGPRRAACALPVLSAALRDATTVHEREKIFAEMGKPAKVLTGSEALKAPVQLFLCEQAGGAGLTREAGRLVAQIDDGATRRCCLGKLASTLPSESFVSVLPIEDRPTWEPIAGACAAGSEACTAAIAAEVSDDCPGASGPAKAPSP